ncbi:Fungal transcription factor [Penicillium ucsense]|uniref:Fungal transcription factor n=1 Tax=Penicillium ucsense TaxID=2839758 RepID=A0A8J8WFV3_9EURO|nr:Fungal transcription factor [Penicillium ucsense]KAF7733657.1 Fungal transcription factor [Penicillium ucsense]
MTRNPDGPPHFQFVQGPSLDRKARSALIRRRISEKRNTYREEEELKRQRLIAHRQSQIWYSTAPVCVCRHARSGDEIPSPSLPQNLLTTRSPDRPTSSYNVCGNCGRIKPSYYSRDRSVLAALKPPNPTGMPDPFLTALSTLGPDVKELLQFSVVHILPHFRGSYYTARCYQSWVVDHLDDQLVLYSVFWSTSCHRETLRVSSGSDSDADSRVQLYYKGCLLRLVREHVADFHQEKWRDGIIMAILFMAINETERGDLSRDPTPFVPPFIHLQSLSFYGSRDYHQLHWNVVFDIITKLGGIDRIKLFALGWLASLADLMHAAHTLSKPKFPMIDPDGNVSFFAPTVQPFPIPVNMPERQGFKELLLVHPPVKESIVDAFQRLSLYSALIQWASTRQPDIDELDRFGDFCYTVHHTLLSLPDEHDPLETIFDQGETIEDDCSGAHRLYLTCRLAAHLYSLHVTYPLPRSALTRSMILPRLIQRLDRSIQTTQPNSTPLLLWCAAIAGIAAEGSDDEARFTDHLRTLCRKLYVGAFETFHDILRSFAWVEVACLLGCRRLWDRLDIDVER